MLLKWEGKTVCSPNHEEPPQWAFALPQEAAIAVLCPQTLRQSPLDWSDSNRESGTHETLRLKANMGSGRVGGGPSGEDSSPKG